MTRNRKQEMQQGRGPLWYKDAVVYEVHIRAYRDSNGDGRGDIRGLTEKLDYLKDLGVTAIWLLPFYPSPLKDDGYDTSDYKSIHRSYGTMRDFRVFLREAHRRDLRVITELVLNHTSDQHPWFQRSRRDKPGGRWRNFYVWSDSPQLYKETRIIFKDFESSNWAWDPLTKSYYWHRFYSHQPDLNYDSLHVRRAMLRVIDFWLGLGVDGLRLDAVPYLYEREGTNCENLPETYEFLRDLRRYVDSRFDNRMLLAEANQWPEDAGAYFGEGDRCHMAFHFPLMPRLFMALRMEDRFPIIDILEQTPDIPESCQWALFLRNHDELTLEMVTDEERDYMYRVYAEDEQMRINLGIRRRLAPLLGNHRRRIELMNGLLFSLPGTPVIYYGDEIGMGDNPYLGDRNGVRTPMQWTPDRNAGFSTSNPHRLYLPVIIDPEYHYESINVEAMQNNTHSLLWWMKRIVALRKRFKAFGRGTLEFLYPENRKILAFIRRCQEECILIVANLSRFVQYGEFDLSGYSGRVPVELFGGTEFPRINEHPYFLSLGPHSFYWFALESRGEPEVTTEISALLSQLPVIEVAGGWGSLLEEKNKSSLENILPSYLRRCRWFGGKARRIKSTKITEVIPMHHKEFMAYGVMVCVDYAEGDPETYLLPMTCANGVQADRVIKDYPQAALARLSYGDSDEQCLLIDASIEKNFCELLLHTIAGRRRRKGMSGELLAAPTRVFRQIRSAGDQDLEPSILHVEQSNTSVVFGRSFILKLFRRLQAGVNPDLEIGRFLTERGFTHIPPVAGAIEYEGPAGGMSLAILMGFVPNEGDAWEYTLDVLSHYFEHALSQRGASGDALSVPLKPLLGLVDEEFSPVASEMIGPYREAARLLGQRTAEMHVALASESEDTKFSPEAFSKLYQRSLYQSMRSLVRRVWQLFRSRLAHVPEDLRGFAREILDREDEILDRFRPILGQKITALRTRCHGDFHLGQVLYTGKDFVMIDFEGEPARPISERRIKRSPLRDVAGMLRSFQYAVYASLFLQESSGLLRHEDLGYLEEAGRFWQIWVCVSFLKAYFEIGRRSNFLPESLDELQLLLDIYLLEKAVYELGYELNNRPTWVKIPLEGIKQLLDTPR